ncbi:putative E3 ubiquitin-protein ligase ARI9 [Glycine soja]|uniref:RBR-type E3 ubiquitin transferase n=1 Tax=Glycine soja TaxID=3848 RepID=A0A445FQ02_GLYSO|nr:putative E3 ubiquitin-protein ligase ARI9 [Glycine soja]
MIVKQSLQAENEQEQPHLLTSIKLNKDLLKSEPPIDHDHSEAKKSDQPSQFLCGICFDDKPLSDMFKDGKCNHPFCTHCISKHVVTQIHQSILKVICPDPNCYVEFKPEYLRTILPCDVIDRWECLRRESLILGSEKTYCPFKDCSVLLVNQGGEVATSAECPSCHRRFCAHCKAPWHGRKKCKEFQRVKKNEKKLDKKFFNLAKEKNWKKCPHCTMFVQRCGGCDHIACRCGCNFCYICGKNWNPEHRCMIMKRIVYDLYQRTVGWFRRANLRFSGGRNSSMNW